MKNSTLYAFHKLFICVGSDQHFALAKHISRRLRNFSPAPFINNFRKQAKAKQFASVYDLHRYEMFLLTRCAIAVTYVMLGDLNDLVYSIYLCRFTLIQSMWWRNVYDIEYCK